MGKELTVYEVPNFDRPLCAEVDPEMFFYPDISDPELKTKFTIDKAKKICKRCEHIEPCAEYGLYNRVFGIWGGLSATDRDLIRKLRGILAKDIANTHIISDIKSIIRKGRYERSNNNNRKPSG